MSNDEKLASFFMLIVRISYICFVFVSLERGDAGQLVACVVIGLLLVVLWQIIILTRIFWP